MNKKWALAAMLGGMFSVQAGASIAKMLFREMGPAGVASLRIGIAGLLLGVLNRPKFWRFSREQWFCILFYGVSLGTMNLIFYYGIRMVPLGIGVAIEFIGPLGVALLGSRKPLDFVWALLAMAGITLLVPWRGGHGALSGIGIGCCAVAGVMWGLYVVASARIAGKLPSRDAVTCGMWVAALLVVPFGVLSGDLGTLDSHRLLLGCGVAVLSGALPFTLDLLAIRRLPARTFSVLQSLQPAVGALEAWIFVGERLSLMQWLSVLCVMTASGGAAFFAPEKK